MTNLSLKDKSIEWKHTDSGKKKKKFVEQLSVKKVMLTVFWEMKGLTSFDFFENRCNSKQYFLLPIPLVNFTLIIE